MISKVIFYRKSWQNDENNHSDCAPYPPKIKMKNISYTQENFLTGSTSEHSNRLKSLWNFLPQKSLKILDSYLSRIVYTYYFTGNLKTRWYMKYLRIFYQFLQWCKGSKNSLSHLEPVIIESFNFRKHNTNSPFKNTSTLYPYFWKL